MAKAFVFISVLFEFSVLNVKQYLFSNILSRWQKYFRMQVLYHGYSELINVFWWWFEHFNILLYLAI